MSVGDLLSVKCEEALDYPKSLIRCRAYPYVLEAYFDRLNGCEDRLFQDEDKAAVNFSEFATNAIAFWHTQVRNVDELKKRLRIGCPSGREDPLCRFVFIHAPHSREALNATREMVALILTYHQVMPAFLDYLFPFGRQDYPQDFHFSGFHEETCLAPIDKGLRIPELGRSGNGFEIAYSLKSVESSKDQLPWSIRQCAIYHSFDVENGRSLWIFVKGNQKIKNRIKSVMDSDGLVDISSFETVECAFASSLAAHLVLCDWAGENWRWYINYLEQDLQKTTRCTLTEGVEDSASRLVQQPAFPAVQDFRARADTDEIIGRSGNKKANSIKDISSRVVRKDKLTTRLASPGSEKTFVQPKDSHKIISSRCQPFPTIGPPPTSIQSVSECKMAAADDTDNDQAFSFSHLQKIQYIEEKANESLLVLKSNINVIRQLREHYSSINESEDWPQDLKSKNRRQMLCFQKRLAAIESYHREQEERVEVLLALLANRKSLLYGILEYKNMEANKILAWRAHQSTHNMETISRDTRCSTVKMEKSTRDMHDIAQKTKQETVSMRIITLVTLFFLPGTFISTLMSTDIVTFPTPSANGVVELPALKLYLAISLPLVSVTLFAWYVVYWYETRKEMRKIAALENKA